MANAAIYPACFGEARVRRAARVDTAQRAIIAALKAIGCSVHFIKEPVDLMVGYRSRTLCLEVKTPGAWKLTPQQQLFFATFRGEAYIVENVDQALEAVLHRKSKA